MPKLRNAFKQSQGVHQRARSFAKVEKSEQIANCGPYTHPPRLIGLCYAVRKAGVICRQSICVFLRKFPLFIDSQYGRFVSFSEKLRNEDGTSSHIRENLTLGMQNIRVCVQVRNCMRPIMRCAGLRGSLPASINSFSRQGLDYASLGREESSSLGSFRHSLEVHV